MHARASLSLTSFVSLACFLFVCAQGDEGMEAGGLEKHLGHVVEHVRHAILKAQGLLQLQSRAAPPAEGNGNGKKQRKA